MIGHKEWLINLDASKKSSVKLGNNTYLATKGVRDIVIKRKDKRIALIEKIFFVP